MFSEWFSIVSIAQGTLKDILWLFWLSRSAPGELFFYSQRHWAVGCLGVSSELRQREFGWQYCSAPFWNSCFPLIFWGMGCLCGLNLLQLFLPVLRACTARLYSLKDLQQERCMWKLYSTPLFISIF